MDSRPSEYDPTPDDRIAALVNEYFDRREAGEDLTPERFAGEHPELEDDLRPYLAGLALLDRVRAVGVSSPPSDGRDSPEATLPVIPGYELKEELGRGGMGVVYKALQVSTKRTVALKVMLAGPFASPAARRRFQREVELAARLQHPGIVRILESGQAGGLQYYSMDYVEGVPLHRYLADTGPDVRAILGLFRRIGEVVDYAHRHGVIHRDLKPGNVLIDADGAPHILDFGLAKAVESMEPQEPLSTPLSVSGQFMGTLPYLAPEQAAAPADGRSGPARSVGDARTDVYGLGVMLFEALTGTLPFEVAGNPSDVIKRILEEPPPAPSSFSARVDRELETIILKALEKDPARRYPSAWEFGEDLRRYLEGEPIAAQRPSRLYVLRKKVLKHRLRIGLGVAAMVLGIGSLWGGMWWSRHARERQRLHERPAARAWLLQLQQRIERGEAAGQVGDARVVARDFPELPEAPLVLAQAQFWQEDLRCNSLRYLEGVAQGDPSRWPCRALLAEMYAWTGDARRAAELQASAEHADTDSAEDWYLRSFATLRPQQAVGAAEQAVARDPRYSLAWDRLAHLYIKTGRLDEALEAAEKVIQLGGDVPDWTLLKGSVSARKREFAQALEYCSRVVAMRPDYPTAYRFRAHVYRRLGRYTDAVSDYSTALRLDAKPTSSVWDYYQRATVLRIFGDTEAAVEDLRRVRMLRGQPSYADARLFLLLRELQRPAEAGAVLEAAMREVTDRGLDRVFACLTGRLHPKELVEAAGENRKQLCEACYYAGEACLLAGRTAEARQWFEQCVQTGLEFDPESLPLTPMNEYELAQWRLRSVPFSDLVPVGFEED